MELNKKTLEDVRFKSKGRWYDAGQVDDFIDEIIEALDYAEENVVHDTLPEEPVPKETKEASEVTDIKEEIKRLTAQKEELTKNIQLLKGFKEQFKGSISADIEKIKEQIEKLESDTLL